MMRSDHSLLKEFLYHNADWMIGMQNHFINQAKTRYSSTQEGRKDSGFGDDEDLFNTLVKEAAAILLHDVNVGASTSGNADSAGTR